MKTKKTTIRYRGECQICAGRFNLSGPEGGMVHHGYTRPGEGYQTPSCSGYGGLPYERSCDLVVLDVESLGRAIQTSEEFLRHLRSGDVELLYETPYSRTTRPAVPVAVLRPADPEAPGEYAWRELVKRKIREEERRLQMLREARTRQEERVAAFVLRPVETYDETIEEEAEKAASRARKEEKAALKRAKTEALAKKRAAVEAKRREKQNVLVEKIREKLPEYEEKPSSDLGYKLIDLFSEALRLDHAYAIKPGEEPFEESLVLRAYAAGLLERRGTPPVYYYYVESYPRPRQE